MMTGGEPVAADELDELDEQAASRLTAVTAAGIANQAAPWRSRRPLMFPGAEDTTFPLLAASGRIAPRLGGMPTLRSRLASGLP